MLPVQKPTPTYRTLDEIQNRKDELLAELHHDNEQFTSLWGKLFVKRSDATKGEWISSLVGNSITAIDTFLLVRKLIKNYGFLFKRKK